MNQQQPLHFTNPHARALEKQHVRDELSQAIGNAHDVLFRASTVFPLTLFPDTLTIDRTKLSVTHRELWGAGEVISINIEDILNVTATVGPFFGSIRISTRFFDPDKPYELKHLWRKDALKIKRITQGYVLAKQNGVDCTVLSTPELAKILDEYGKVSSEDTV